MLLFCGSKSWSVDFSLGEEQRLKFESDINIIAEQIS